MGKFRRLTQISSLKKKLVVALLTLSLIAPTAISSFAVDMSRDKANLNVKSEEGATEESEEEETGTPGEGGNEGEVVPPGEGEGEPDPEPEVPEEEGVLFKDAFDDEVFKAYIKNEYKGDIDEDTFIVTSETFKDIKLLDLYQKNISSLKGIEYFQYLEVLECSRNDLVKLDLSQNKKLESVYAYRNNISNIILPESGMIDNLSIWGNELSKIDIPEKLNINTLNLELNNFTSLTLSYPNVKELYCQSNGLKSLDISNCTSLTSITCGGNSLKQVDLSKNVNLTEADLGKQNVEYDLTNHAGQFAIFIGKSVNTGDYKTKVTVKTPNYGEYTSAGYITLGNAMMFVGDYSYTNANYIRIYELNGKVFTMDITSRLKKVKEEEPEEEKPTTKFENLNGPDRYDTSIKISKNGFTSAENVILVNDSSIPDALSVTPFAKVKNAPILLTKNNKLEARTKAEIVRLKAKNIYIIGGENSVSSEVEKNLVSEGYVVQRITGSNRYDTSLNIAKELKKYINFNEIAVVNGVKGLPDAVSIAGIAAEKGMPVLLTHETDDLNGIKSFIGTTTLSNSYLVGGINQFPSDINSKIPKVYNIYGANRNETNTKVLNKFYTKVELNNTYVCKNGMARQSDLIDALSVGTLSAKNSSPVMLVGSSLDQGQEDFIKSKKFKIVTRIGGNGNENAYNSFEKIIYKK